MGVGEYLILSPFSRDYGKYMTSTGYIGTCIATTTPCKIPLKYIVICFGLSAATLYMYIYPCR